MIKGHAVIELKDESTGKIWRTEHDNMITNGLKYALTPWLGKFSYANTGPNSEFQIMTSENKETRKSQNRSIMNHLLGGVFLFQNPLTEDVDNVAFPNDNPLTGKASWDAYSGMDTSRGSYNESESGMQEDGSYKHVWDFNTQQANGQISALSLTTYMGGICGDGFADWNYSTENQINGTNTIEFGKIKARNSTDTYPIIFSRPQKNEAYIPATNYQLWFSSNYQEYHFSHTGKLTLKKIKMPLTKISPFYDYYNQYMEETLEIQIPAEFMEYAQNKSCVAYTSDRYVHIYCLKNMNTNEPVCILRIKKEDLTAETINITIDTSDSNTGIPTSDSYIDITDKYMYFSKGFAIWRTNLDTSETEKIILPEDRPQIKCLAGYIYAGATTSPYKMTCINENTLEIKHYPNMLSIGYMNRGFEKITPNIYLERNYNTGHGNNYEYAKIHILSNSLMTINNLPSPVVKTASQSMKITYTIQETDTET